MVPSPYIAVPISQASTTNGATASGNIDGLGFSYAVICTLMATSNAVSNNPSVFKLSQSDDTVVTNFANVSGAVGDTDFTIADAKTSGDWLHLFKVDLRGKKRYLKLSISPTTTQVITAIAMMFRAEELPIDATTHNVTQVVNVA